MGSGPARRRGWAGPAARQEPRMTRRTARLGLGVTGVALVAVGIAIAALVLPGDSPAKPFPALRPSAAPVGWSHMTLPNGTAVLSFPPSVRPVTGDRGAVSVARRDPAGAIVLYLNATPRQGGENLSNWARFRLSRLTEDDASTARKDSAAEGVRFRGGTGSCVMDDYITRVGGHHYQEI